MADDANEIRKTVPDATEANQVAATDAPIEIGDGPNRGPDLAAPTVQPPSPLQSPSTTSARPPPLPVVCCEASVLRGAEKISVWKERVESHMAAGAVPTPIVSSRDWTVAGLVQRGGKNFKPVPRVSVVENSPEEIRSIVLEHEQKGIPLVVGDLHKRADWAKDIYNIDWLLQHGEPNISVRNCLDRRDREMPLREFIDLSRAAPKYAVEGETERLYGKDAPCPKEWQERLKEPFLPAEILPDHDGNMLNTLADSERVETLMCYLGIGDTFTPAHKDLCASTGHNVMCYSEDGGSSFWFMTESSAASDASDLFHSLGYELDHEGLVATPETFKGAKFTVYVAEQKLGDFVLVPPRCCHQVVNHGGLTIKISWSRMTVDNIITAFHYELPLYRRVCRSETYRVKQICHKAVLEYTKKCRDGLSHCTTRPIPVNGDSAVSESPAPTALSSQRESSISIASPVASEELKHNISCLKELVQCFDKILKEEYSFRDESLNEAKAEDDVGGLSCDFCGADIFHTYFECKTKTCVVPAAPTAPNALPGDESAAAAPRIFSPSTGSAESTTSSDSTTSQDAASDMVVAADETVEDIAVLPTPPAEEPDTYTICSPCYAENRSCACGSMLPKRRLNMAGLVKDQHEAVKVVLQYTNILAKRNNIGVPVEWHPKSMRALEHPPLFDIALAILQLKNEPSSGKEYTCSWNSKDLNHPVPAVCAVRCNVCRRRLCMSHILTKGIHSTDVFGFNREDDLSDDKWHKFHARRTKYFHTRMEELEKDERADRPCTVRYFLIKLAMKYGYCSPLRPTVSQLGWYDVNMYFDPRLLEENTEKDSPPHESVSEIKSTSSLTAEVFLAPLSEEERQRYRVSPAVPPVSGQGSSNLASLYNRAATAEVSSRPSKQAGKENEATVPEPEGRTASLSPSTSLNDKVASLFADGERSAPSTTAHAEPNDQDTSGSDEATMDMSDSESSMSGTDSDNEPLTPKPIRSRATMLAPSKEKLDSAPSTGDALPIARVEVTTPQPTQKASEPQSTAVQAPVRSRNEDFPVGPPRNVRPNFRNYTKSSDTRQLKPPPVKAPVSKDAAPVRVSVPSLSRPAATATSTSSTQLAKPANQARQVTKRANDIIVARIAPTLPEGFDSDNSPVNLGLPAKKKQRLSAPNVSRLNRTTNSSAVSGPGATQPLGSNTNSSEELQETSSARPLRGLQFKKKRREPESGSSAVSSSSKTPLQSKSAEVGSSTSPPPAPRKEASRQPPAPTRVPVASESHPSGFAGGSNRSQPQQATSQNMANMSRTTTQSVDDAPGHSANAVEASTYRRVNRPNTPLACDPEFIATVMATVAQIQPPNAVVSSDASARLAALEAKLSQQEAIIQYQGKKLEKAEEIARRLELEVIDIRKRHDDLTLQYKGTEATVNKLERHQEIETVVQRTQRQTPSSSIVVQTNPAAETRTASPSTGATREHSEGVLPPEHATAGHGNGVPYAQQAYHTHPHFHGTPKPYFSSNKRPYTYAQQDGYNNVQYHRPPYKHWSTNGYNHRSAMMPDGAPFKRPRTQFDEGVNTPLREEELVEVRRRASMAKEKSSPHYNAGIRSDSRNWQANKDYSQPSAADDVQNSRRDDGYIRREDKRTTPPLPDDRHGHGEERSRSSHRSSRFNERDSDRSHRRHQSDRPRSRSRHRSRHRSAANAVEADVGPEAEAVASVFEADVGREAEAGTEDPQIPQESRARTPERRSSEPPRSASSSQAMYSTATDFCDNPNPWENQLGATGRTLQ